MSRFLGAFVLVVISSLVAVPSFAGGIDTKNNHSAEYVRTFNRNAATDAADIVIYNPAGTSFMEDGLYVNGSIQYLVKEYTNTIGGTEYESDTPSVIPAWFWAGIQALPGSSFDALKAPSSTVVLRRSRNWGRTLDPRRSLSRAR